mmetsp:Transcript_38933/g.84939  ORF Transcript_38933/g.84939 Transcript_38933/m.84939 type:complete len:242 (-) Transcript_38933:2049-2774(-)
MVLCSTEAPQTRSTKRGMARTGDVATRASAASFTQGVPSKLFVKLRVTTLHGRFAAAPSAAVTSPPTPEIPSSEKSTHTESVSSRPWSSSWVTRLNAAAKFPRALAPGLYGSSVRRSFKCARSSVSTLMVVASSAIIFTIPRATRAEFPSSTISKRARTAATCWPHRACPTEVDESKMIITSSLAMQTSAYFTATRVSTAGPYKQYWASRSACFSASDRRSRSIVVSGNGASTVGTSAALE